VIGELACTFPGDAVKAQNLCLKYQRLCVNRILKHLPRLLKEEYCNFLLNLDSKVDVFIDSEDDIFIVLDDLVSGKLADHRVQDFISSEQGRKKQAQKNIKKQLKKYSQEKTDQIRNFPSFESYWINVIRETNYLTDNIEFLLNGYGLGNQKINHGIALNMAKNMGKIPHWHTVLRIPPLLEWVYINMSKEVKKGDLFDIVDVGHCTFLETFVSDDELLKERIPLLLPHLKVFSLDGFLAELKGVK